MVTVPAVPQYRDRETLRGRNQQGVSLSISPEQFGAAIGRGLSDLAGGINSFADAVKFRDDLKAEADARVAVNEYRDVLRSGLYDPQTGYLVRTGGNALNGSRGRTFDSLAQARSDIEGRLSPAARRTFSATADGLDNSAQDTAIRHEGVEFRNFTMQTFEASAQGFLDDALLNYNDQAKFSQNVAAAEREIRNAAALQGTPTAVLEEKVSALHSTAEAGRVIEMARTDPIAAYDYLIKAGDTIDREQYNKLFEGLEPAYYAARARSWVDTAGGINGARPEVPVGDTITYTNQGATRNLPLSRELTAAMTPVLEELGLGFEVFSGGQVTAEEAARGEGGRVGSTRHDHGDAADGYFTKNGQRLSWEDQGHRAVIFEAIMKLRQAGLTGFGAGEGYMRPGSVHIGFGTPAVWGAGGKDRNVAPWLQEAVAAAEAGGVARLPPSSVGVTMAEAMQIDDPKLRTAVMREIELRRTAYASDRAERTRVAGEQAWSIVDQGGRPEDIPPELQAEVGLTTMNQIFAAYERNTLGVDVTDEGRHLELLDMAVNDPQAFAQLDLNAERPSLSRGDLLSLLELQSEAKTRQQTLQTQGAAALVYDDADFRAAFNDAAEQYQAATGARPGANMSQEQTAQYNRFTQQLMSAMRSFANENQRAMTFEERTNLVNTLLAPTVIDGVNSGIFGGKAFLFDVPTQAREGFELTLDRGAVPPAEEQRITETLTRAFGRAPSTDEVVEQYENELLLSLGISPAIEYREVPRDLRRKIAEQYPDASEDQIVDIFRTLMLEAAVADRVAP